MNTEITSYEDVYPKKQPTVSGRVEPVVSADLACAVKVLTEKLRLANLLIDKIDDKKYRQMICTYRTLTESH